MNKTNENQNASSRLASLDQFRGYTVVGMLLVNYIGAFHVVPAVFKHHNTYCSYADTIMPQFFFAVGFAFRLTFLRRREVDGVQSAYARVLRRLVGLFLISLVVHAPGRMANSWVEWWELGPSHILFQAFKSDYFQTLMHITATSLWITPVIGGSMAMRILYGIFSLTLHLLLSWWFYFDFIWMEQPCIDGGPLGFLTWSAAALGGSVAYDIVMKRQQTLWRLISAGTVLMVFGWGLSCLTTFYDQDHRTGHGLAKINGQAGEGELAEQPVFPAAEDRAPLSFAEPPFVPPPPSRLLNYWMMSQRAGTVSYLVFATGLSLAVFALFVYLADYKGLALPFFQTFGSNALIAYILHSMVDNALRAWAPTDAPAWYLCAMIVVFFAVNYVILRGLEKQGMFVRL